MATMVGYPLSTIAPRCPVCGEHCDVWRSDEGVSDARVFGVKHCGLEAKVEVNLRDMERGNADLATIVAFVRSELERGMSLKLKAGARPFVECDACRAKLGSPTLCVECLGRRDAHWRGETAVKEMRHVMQLVQERLDSLRRVDSKWVEEGSGIPLLVKAYEATLALLSVHVDEALRAGVPDLFPPRPPPGKPTVSINVPLDAFDPDRVARVFAGTMVGRPRQGSEARTCTCGADHRECPRHGRVR